MVGGSYFAVFPARALLMAKPSHTTPTRAIKTARIAKLFVKPSREPPCIAAYPVPNWPLLLNVCTKLGLNSSVRT